MKYRKWMGIVGVVAITLMGMGNAWSDDAASQCGKLYAQKHYKAAFPVCNQAAEQGNALAQSNLSLMYYKGIGVKQDYVEAVKWFRKAAIQGVASAKHNLGLMYYNGNGVKQDYTEAEKWYRKAAAQGVISAQYNLGLMYYKGNGVKQDYAEAAKWFRKAAAQGVALAQYNLGVMYAIGKGTMQSGAAAADWFYKAGVSFLKQGNREKALLSVEQIKKLSNVLHLTVPNAFLADKLLDQIYGRKSK